MDIKIINKEDINIKLIKKLYKEGLYEKTFNEDSHFKFLFELSIVTNMVQDEIEKIILLKEKNKIIGLSIIERVNNYKIELFRNKDQFKLNSKKLFKLDKFFEIDFWFQVFIKEEYRKNGFGSLLVKEFENHFIDNYFNNYEKNVIPLIYSVGDATKLLEKNLKNSYTINKKTNSVNFLSDIHHLTYKYINDVLEQNKIFKFDELNNYKINICNEEENNKKNKRKLK